MMFLYPALIVAYRQFLSWRTNWRTFILMRLAEPAIFFYGIGLGFAQFIPTINGYPYVTYLLPGSICLAAAFAGLFEGTYNAFSRCYMQRTWFSFLATPTRLWHILTGEIAWNAFRNLISTILLIGVGLLAGVKIDPLGTLLSLPFIMLGVMSITAIGLVCMSFAKSMNDFDYLWAFFATPMMVFSGVMIDIHTFPDHVQVIAWLLPLTHLLAIVRPLMLGYADITTIVNHSLILGLITIVSLIIAHYRLNRAILN